MGAPGGKRRGRASAEWHLLNGLHGSAWGVTYWRDASEEVDFVVSQGMQDWAIEVKSGRSDKLSGVTAFRKHDSKAKAWLVGATGINLEEFSSRSAPSGFSEGIGFKHGPRFTNSVTRWKRKSGARPFTRKDRDSAKFKFTLWRGAAQQQYSGRRANRDCVQKCA